MSKSPNLFAGAALIVSLAALAPAHAQDATKGEKVFAKCKACHAIGEGAKNRVGPELNALFGRTAGSLADFKYSTAMTEAGAGGLVWSDDTLTTYLASPKAFVKGTKMSFAGLKKETDIADLLAYLKQAGGGGDAAAAPAEPAKTETAAAEPDKPAEEPKMAAAPAADPNAPPHGNFNLGRAATEDEIAAWNIDVRPDGLGLPDGHGTVSEGEALFTDNCAVCHGDFGEGVGRWPVLAGGQDTLKDERPVKTIGSYWPYLSTVYDYVKRAMPFGNARSLSDNDVYALTAYLMYLNDIVTDEDFELSKENFTSIHMPNEENFKEDDRDSEPNYAEKTEPCMTDCKPDPAKISMRAAVLDVTPDAANGDEVGAGSVE